MRGRCELPSTKQDTSFPYENLYPVPGKTGDRIALTSEKDSYQAEKAVSDLDRSNYWSKISKKALQSLSGSQQDSDRNMTHVQMFDVGAHSIDGQLRDSWCGISGFDSGPWMWEKKCGSGLLLLKIRCVIRDHWCGKSGTHGMGKQVLFPEPLVVQRPESDPGSLVHKTLVCKMPRFGTIGVGNPL